ncbi:MAG TPA: SulP family inorganic anion transporter [Rubricoccaceae bacterium]|jgi:MFS superfamily sulfate permease-like transporter
MHPSLSRGVVANLRHDVPAALVVFLVAVPLCLGIALASGAPLFSGIIAGIVGGIVVGLSSRSAVGVSGPAAGLAVIVLTAIETLGTFPAFLTAVVLAGVMQIALGYARAGVIGYYVPSSVIKGMLAGIGVLIVLKQIPHALGYDGDYMGNESFAQADGFNTVTELGHVLGLLHPGAIAVSALGVAVLIGWESKAVRSVRALALLPGPLVAVVVGVLGALLLAGTPWAFRPDQLVNLPVAGSLAELRGLFAFPDVRALGSGAVWTVAATLAVVASLETLLSVEAADKLDPYRRVTPTDRELKAQGLGNVVSGLLGGLPVTQVIVRSSANVLAGARTRMSAVYHGVLLLVCAFAIPHLLNLIPLSALAAVLLLVGYKLAKPAIAVDVWRRGKSQFVPFAVTVLGIVFADLLVGIALGLAVSLVTVLYQTWHVPYAVRDDGPGAPVRLVLSENVSFFNKASLQHALEGVPDGGRVVVDARRAAYVDPDVVEMLGEYHANAESRGIEFSVLGDPRGHRPAPPTVLRRKVDRRIASAGRPHDDGVRSTRPDGRGHDAPVPEYTAEAR